MLERNEMKKLRPPLENFPRYFLLCAVLGVVDVAAWPAGVWLSTAYSWSDLLISDLSGQRGNFRECGG